MPIATRFPEIRFTVKTMLSPINSFSPSLRLSTNMTYFPEFRVMRNVIELPVVQITYQLQVANSERSPKPIASPLKFGKIQVFLSFEPRKFPDRSFHANTIGLVDFVSTGVRMEQLVSL